MIHVATIADMADLVVDYHGFWTIHRSGSGFLVSFETDADAVVRDGDTVAEAAADVINTVRGAS